MKTADPSIHFFDLEVVPAGPQQGKVVAWACLRGEEWHVGTDIQALFEKLNATPYLCAHNLLAHDLQYLPKHLETNHFLAAEQKTIDTLYLSSLLFPAHPYHHLVKDYQLASNAPNDPKADVQLLLDLFWDCVQAWQMLSEPIRRIYTFLLQNHAAFAGFFDWIQASPPDWSLEICAKEIQASLLGKVCFERPAWLEFLEKEPLLLAFTLSLLLSPESTLAPAPWLLYRYPQIQVLLESLRGRPCHQSACFYCKDYFDLQTALQHYFGFAQFRKYDENNLQEEIVKATLAGESLLAVLPTGGGKSLTFQLPALMQGEALGALTVVISPLQSLMKDQVDNLSLRFEIEGAVTLNGAMTAVERKMAIEAVESGKAALLYISPESLRSNTVLRLLKNRTIARFVIDEAHCFSTWGQDFRVDYLYLARFMQLLQSQKGLNQAWPVSCFTATAKQSVQTDILNYFKARLNLELRSFQSSARRSNLLFQVFATEQKDKFQKLKLLLVERSGPKIVYTSSTKNVEKLAQKLKAEGIPALPFHGQMERTEKLENMTAFMAGESEVIVATSAFGMGVDKENVSMVIHYEISDSLEDYMQEAGRAGRKAELEAACYVLFDEDDLNFHFQLLNQQRLNQKEINQIWSALKRLRTHEFSRSTLEIARDAGWDLEQKNLEVRVKTAIAALEEVHLLERNQNDTLLLAGYFATCPIDVANSRIAASPLLQRETDQTTAKRIFQYLLSRAALHESQQLPLRFDWLCEHLGLESQEAHRILNALRQADLIRSQSLQTITLSTGRTPKTSSRLRLELLHELETALLTLFEHDERESLPYSVGVSLKEINHRFKKQGINSSLEDLRQILRHAWSREWVSSRRTHRQQETYLIHLHKPWPLWAESVAKQQNQQIRVLDFLESLPHQQSNPGKRSIAFALEELQKSLQNQIFDTYSVNLHEADLLLLALHKSQVIDVEDGVALFYTRMRILRLEGGRKSFTQAHYEHLKSFYEHKIQQIHMVGEYAKKMLTNQLDALAFVEDYFQLAYPEFLKTYFPHKEDQQKLSQPLTPQRFKQIFGELSAEQLAVVKDQQHSKILVAAGPGSGKTRLLVHKVAALLMLEEVKPEQFLMLTYSRPAAQEMRQRLLALIGKAAWGLDIATFHAYAFQLMERPGDKDVLENIIEEATAAIIAEDLPNRARLEQKSIVLVDEYQDISQREYAFLKALLDVASEVGDPRVIVVGDDDQNIYEFRGSSTKFMREFASDFDSQSYYLQTNYRSAHNLVAFTNAFTHSLKDRIKAGIDLLAWRSEMGELELVQYSRPQFFMPFVEQLKAALSEGSCAVLCATNEEALLLTTLLNQQGVPAQQLMDLDHFKLRDLLELQLFLHYLKERVSALHGFISPENWSYAHERVKHHCQGSKSLPLLEQILKDFSASHERLVLNEWEDWVGEMRWEDVRPVSQGEKVIVSTMHKAKGKEFDQVYLYLDRFKLETQADYRVLYVAMTRARNHLAIHTRQSWLNGVHGLQPRMYDTPFEAPHELLIQLGLREIQLGYAKGMQDRLLKAVAGRPLQILKVGLFKEPLSGSVIQVSRKFEQHWQKLLNQGYRPVLAEVGYLVRWFDKEEQKSYRVALPQMRWEK